MAGGGDQTIDTFAELRERVKRGHVPLPPPWDKRPGELEATRNLPPIAVAGAHEADGWKVLLMARALQTPLTPAAARELAEQLVGYAALLEGGRW